MGPIGRGDNKLNITRAFLSGSSQLQSTRAAERPTGGAAVCGAASGTGPEAAAGVQGRGSPAAAPHSQTREEET